MAQILHIIQQLSRGGAARATVYLAKYSRDLAGHEHTILSLLPPENPEAVKIAFDYDVRVISGLNRDQIQEQLAKADIVQISWWNNVDVGNLLQSPLPPMRLAGWFHVGGTAVPQVITPTLVDFFDIAIACSPYTYQCAAFQSLSPTVREQRTAMVYGATDFGRLTGLVRRKHSTFNVGYIGTVDFVKMHRDYVAMSAAVKIPEVRFVIGGIGGAQRTIEQEAAALGVSDRFVQLGYVEDVRNILEELDVYGYPLCEDTYAASEMNLQEAMFAGIPAVLFPYGGVKELVTHNESALLVSSAKEYTEAIEYLYNNPSERERIGNNAQRYAAEFFGAENAGRDINKIYDRLLSKPKRERVWGGSADELLSGSVRIGVEDIYFPQESSSGAARFIASLGSEGTIFLESMKSKDLLVALKADLEIRNSSRSLWIGGVASYKNAFLEDPWLVYWEALIQQKSGSLSDAAMSYTVAASKGLQNGRLCWFLSLAVRDLGENEASRNLYNQAKERMIAEYGIAKTEEAIRLLSAAGLGW